MLKEKIKKIAIENAIIHKGKASDKAVFKKIISFEEARKDVEKTRKLVLEVVKEINKLDEKKLVELAKKYKIEIKKEKREKHLEYPKLQNVIEGKVKTCFPPEPSKAPHLGHAYAALVNYWFAKKHKGKFILRFEDTNPKLARKKFYEIMKRDLEWLGIKEDYYYNASEKLEILYQKAEELIKRGLAYVCFCEGEEIKKKRLKKEECIHRKQKPEENLKYWKEMLDGKYGEGEAVLRAKIDMKNNNPTLRDPTIMRIIEEKHPFVDAIVWPTYAFQNVILDSLDGITHRFRSKEFESVVPLQEWIAKNLSLKRPVTYEYARVEIEGGLTSGRKIRELIEKGEIKDWDDIRLLTISALRRRGFTKEAIWEFVDKMGLSKHESKIKIDVLEAFNRKIISKISLPIGWSEEMKENFYKTKLYIPNGEKIEEREIYIDKNPEEIEGKIIRLKKLCFAKVEKGNLIYTHK